MILTGDAIKANVNNGRIIISDFDESRLNPNSYNLRLGNKLVVYDAEELDMAKEQKTTEIDIPEDGYVLQPGKLYLANTLEYTETVGFVPMLEGRSSIGRLGLNIHATAGFGDIGFAGYWTLELSCVQPIRIYAGVELCQIYYHTVAGETSITYANGKYQKNNGIQASMLWKEFQKDNRKDTVS